MLILAILTYLVVLFNTPLKDVAATVVLHKKKYYLFLIYSISPNIPLDKEELKALISQLSRPFLFLEPSMQNTLFGGYQWMI